MQSGFCAIGVGRYLCICNIWFSQDHQGKVWQSQSTLLFNPYHILRTCKTHHCCTMKHFLLHSCLKRIALLSILLIYSVTAAFGTSVTVIVDGINYDFYYSGDGEDAQADYAVVANNYGYSGIANIRSSITYEYKYRTKVGYDNTTFPPKPIYEEHTKNLTANVTSIVNEAFYDYHTGNGSPDLTSVIIPNTVKTIGYKAFYNCTALTSVNFPSTLTSISDYAFYGCTSLSSINIPYGISNIYEGTFEMCTSLNSVNIPNSVTTIDGQAFYGCTSLTSVNIPNSVITIGEDDFNGDKEGAFGGCTGLKSVTIGNSVTTIGCGTFADCTGLENVIIGDAVTTISYLAFIRCTALTSVNIPDNVTIINGNAFGDCTGLTKVTIGKNVTHLYDAFNGCDGIKELIWNAKHCEEAINYSFDYNNAPIVPKYESITIGDEVEYLPPYFAKDSRITEIYLPSSLTEIGKYAFYGCSSIPSATIGENITSIGQYAFYNCTSLSSPIIIPDGMSIIAEKTFYGCSSIPSISIGKNITSIGENAFYNCNPIELTWNARNCTRNGGMKATNLERLTIGNEVEVIPSRLAHSAKISELTIPESVTTIGEYAFYDCKNLTELVIHESVSTIGDFAFAHTTGLKKLIWNAIHCTSKGSMAAGNLEDITIGPKVEILPDGFANQSKIDHIDIPNSVTSIGGQAFSNCSNLTEITIPESVTSVGPLAFYNCINLRRVNWNAIDCSTEFFYNMPIFYMCNNVRTIAVGGQVVSIGGVAFQGCNNVDSVICYATSPPAIADNCFSEECYDNATLYVPDEPEGTKELYEEATGWENFFPRISTITVIVKLLGDVNGDGIVDVVDVVALIDYVLGNNPQPFDAEAADMNGDKLIDVQDVVALIDKVLGNN